jgi:hypothetical protein
LVSALLVTGFQILGRLANLGGGHLVEQTMGRHVLPTQLVTLSLYAFTWLRARSGTRSTRERHVLDAFVTIVPPLCRPELGRP